MNSHPQPGGPRRRPRLRRHLSGATVAALLVASCTLLVAPAAQAMPVFSEADMDGVSDADEMSATACTEAETFQPEFKDTPVAENGTATTGSHQGAGTYTNDGDGTDTISFATEIAGSDRVTSVGANPGSLELKATGSVSASATKSVSGCFVDAYSYVDLDYTFTLADPGFLTITTKASPHTYGGFYVRDNETGNSRLSVEGGNLKFDGVHTIYLPAGSYTGDLEAYAWLTTATTVAPTPVGVSINAQFDAVGSQLDAPVGKAARFVALPAARSCATDSLDAAITRKGKRAAKIVRVRFFVNDRLATKVRKPHRGAVVRVPVADDAHAVLRAVVTEASKNGGRRKVSEVVASYAPCS